jgi:ABC-type glycerol-3-phosphate transport system permease component
MGSQPVAPNTQNPTPITHVLMAQQVARLDRVVVPSVTPGERAWGVARRLLGRFGLHLLAIVIGAALMLPLFWALSSSLKQAQEVRQIPPLWLPSVPQWQNYAAVWGSRLFATWTLNSVYLTVVATVGTVLSSSIGGYAFARLRFPGKRLLFALTLATLMLPDYVLLIPNFLLFWKLGWLNTYLPLTVPHFFGNAFFIFLFRQFFLTIPLDLDEAARIDGASHPRIFWSIVLPLSGPAFATAAIIEGIRAWNAFLLPLIVLNLQASFPLAVGMRNLRANDHLHMAAAVMMTVPVIVIFFLGQRYFVRGIAMTGIKG